MHAIFSRCWTQLSFPYKASLCIHLFCIYIRGRCRPWSVSTVRPGQPMCHAAGEASDPGRVKDSAKAKERMERGGRGGAEGVTECLGTCHYASALASASGLLSLWPGAKYDSLTGLDHRVGKSSFLSPTLHAAPLTCHQARHCVKPSLHIRHSQTQHSLNRCLGNVHWTKNKGNFSQETHLHLLEKVNITSLQSRASNLIKWQTQHENLTVMD